MSDQHVSRKCPLDVKNVMRSHQLHPRSESWSDSSLSRKKRVFVIGKCEPKKHFWRIIEMNETSELWIFLKLVEIAFKVVEILHLHNRRTESTTNRKLMSDEFDGCEKMLNWKYFMLRRKLNIGKDEFVENKSEKLLIFYVRHFRLAMIWEISCSI